MTKKDFIKEIRELNKAYRKVNGGKCEGVYINNIYFCYEHIRLCFDDEYEQLFIFVRNQNKIMAAIFYQMIQIGYKILK